MSSSRSDLPQDTQAESEHPAPGNNGAAAEPETESLYDAPMEDDASIVLPSLPEIPAAELDLTLSLESILNPGSTEVEKVQKRASNVLKLAQENEKLQAELKAMTERLEAAERRQRELEGKNKASRQNGVPF